MGFLDRFSKDGRDARAREKNAARAVNKYMQSPDRMKALQALRDDGSDDALFALMKRFGMMYDKSIEDEQEKEWVFEALAEKGAAVIPAIERYLQSADSISWPLRLLSKVASPTHELEIIKKVLERHEPGYERDPTKKIQLLNHLAALKQPGLAALAVPYLADMDEGVRYAAVEALARVGDEAAAREPLIAHLVSDGEESLRVRIQIAEAFAHHGWLVKTNRPAFDQKLPEQFSIGRDGRVQKKPEDTKG